jgi:hypothetical protein
VRARDLSAASPFVLVLASHFSTNFVLLLRRFRKEQILNAASKNRHKPARRQGCKKTPRRVHDKVYIPAVDEIRKTVSAKFVYCNLPFTTIEDYGRKCDRRFSRVFEFDDEGKIAVD